MLVAGRSRELLGIGRGFEGRRGQRGLTAAAREVGRGIGRLVAVKETGPGVELTTQSMKPAMLIFQFGQAQSVLETERDLCKKECELARLPNRVPRHLLCCS